MAKEIGDIIFFKNNSLLSRTIRLVETGKFRQDVPSHVAVIDFLPYGDVSLIEAQGLKVRRARLSKYRKQKLWYARLKEPRDIQEGIHWLNQQIGKRYDFKQLVGIWLRGFWRLLGSKAYKKIRKIRNFLDSKQQFICSELIEGYAEKTGERLWHGDISLVTPYDLWRSSEVIIYEEAMI